MISFYGIFQCHLKWLSEIHSLDQSALRPLQAVAGVANQLMEYLTHQAKKMDLLVGVYPRSA